ncbi:polyphenol oxidase family protein [Paeniglutamicibacter cryotolerans]|uniref:Laccase domain-containing protein n=1 Tax=Paeniglutamicibacter cryotolerans TaxID=670079 RepID=A0A839QRN5_9MICC|nr:polyphenol oxidase family protein [Paeniglutamicibacter cryotolerans]MBB2996636.1 hypothetical protein [Paeniglutamicibacter cryotolerans]
MLRYYPARFPGVGVAFTTVDQGNLALHVGDDPEAVLMRRRELEASLGLDAQRFWYMDQIHSTIILDAGADVLTASTASGHPTADGLISPCGDGALAVMVADCLPVLFIASTASGTATAVAHAGRRGLLDGILPDAVERLRAAGGTDVHAWIGPSICGACYEVPRDMSAEAELQLPGITTSTRTGTPALNLPAAAAAQLRALGVRVEESGICTLEDKRFYSYRRDNSTGRLAGLLWPVDQDKARNAAQ